jgi:hypothetical protein
MDQKFTAKVMSFLVAVGVVAWLDKSSSMSFPRRCYISTDCIKYKNGVECGIEYVRNRLRDENKIA